MSCRSGRDSFGISAAVWVGRLNVDLPMYDTSKFPGPRNIGDFNKLRLHCFDFWVCPCYI